MFTYIQFYFITGRQDPLVLDHELDHDRRLLDGHGRHDPREDSSAGHRPLQRRCFTGRGEGGVRMEIGARGRV